MLNKTLASITDPVFVHTALLIAWGLSIPIAIMFGLLESVAFVSFASIYANMATHWAGREAAKAAQESKKVGDAR